MEKINYNFMPSLEHMSFVAVAIALWKHPNGILLNSFTSEPIPSEIKFQITRQILEERILSKLLLATSIKKKLSDIVIEVAKQICSWNDLHVDILSEDDYLNQIPKLCWSPRGIIDKKKTVEILVKDISLGIFERYMFACTYCLEEDIYILWNQLKRHHKSRAKLESSIVSFWTHYLGKTMHEFSSRRNQYFPHEDISHFAFMFKRSAIKGNDVATKFFLQKLTPIEKKRCLLSTSTHIAKYSRSRIHRSNPETFCIVLSALNEEEMMDLLRLHPIGTIIYFLEWPWHDIFVILSEHLFNFLSEDIYLPLINKCIQLSKEKSDYNYLKFSQMYLLKSPRSLKQDLINKFSIRRTLANLFMLKDKKIFDYILRHATSNQKIRLIFSYEGKSACKEMITCSNWNVLEFLTRECLSTKVVLVNFKIEMAKWITSEEKSILKDKWENFVQLLDNIINDYDKVV